MKNSSVLAGALISFVLLSPPATAQQSKDPSLELQHGINLVFGGLEDATISLDWIKKRGKLDMAAHLIASMRFARLPRSLFDDALQKLTGERDKTSWFEWMLWQQKNSHIKPHESLRGLKAKIFEAIDPNFRRFFRADSEFDIRLEEIVWGGVRVDGIPALDNPTHIGAAEADYLKDGDEVFGVEINGDARAYPLRIMGWHEMFNDVVGGVPISLAYCTLCNAGIVFEGAHPGREKFGVTKPFTFGSTGFLYQSNKLMYDRNTDSTWNQFTGAPVGGKLRGSGIVLKIRPVVITSWAAWKKRHPATKVLSLETGFRRDYGTGVVYNTYFASRDLMFPAIGDAKGRLHKKEQVFGLRLKGAAKAWPLSTFKGGRVVNDKVGTINVVLIGDERTRTVRAYARGEATFSPDKKGGLRDVAGAGWAVTEDALKGPGGRTFKRLPGHVSYWFAWAGYLGEGSTLFESTARK